jgi:hypothetical protein
MSEKENRKSNKDSSKNHESQETNQEKNSDKGEIIPDEILESIPEEERGKVASVIKQTMISGVMRRNNPIAEKITSDHIGRLIDKSDEQDQRDRKERKSERNYNLILLIIGLVFTGFLIVFLQSNEELLIKIVIAIISFIGGLGFGRTTLKSQE